MLTWRCTTAENPQSNRLSLRAPKKCFKTTLSSIFKLSFHLFFYYFWRSVSIESWERSVINFNFISLFYIQTATTDSHNHQRQYGLPWGHHHDNYHAITSDDIGVLKRLSKSGAIHSCHSEHLQHEARAQHHGKQQRASQRWGWDGHVWGLWGWAQIRL